MNRITRYALVLLAASMLISCSQLKITSSKTDNDDLSAYKTYAWVAPGDTALNTRRDDKRYAVLIEKSANAELQKKGMTIDSQNPDAVFMFDTQIDEKTETRMAPVTDNSFTIGGYSYGYGGTGYYAGSYNPMHGLETANITVNEGTISYSMFDRKTGKLLWRGTGSQPLTLKTNIPKVIKKATKFIFTKFPVKHK